MWGLMKLEVTARICCGPPRSPRMFQLTQSGRLSGVKKSQLVQNVGRKFLIALTFPHLLFER
jgi:hypothetical protein